MSSDDDLTERLRRLGLRVGRDALSAFLAHVHRSRLGPTETVEQLVDRSLRLEPAAGESTRGELTDRSVSVVRTEGGAGAGAVT